MVDQGGLGGHIQYEVGMMLDDQQKEFWNSYTAENREKYFWLFLNSFVEKWEQRVSNFFFPSIPQQNYGLAAEMKPLLNLTALFATAIKCLENFRCLFQVFYSKSMIESDPPDPGQVDCL